MTVISESFNKADDGLGPDLTWFEPAGTAPDWEVNTNEARRDGADGLVRIAIADQDLASADHYAQIEVTKFNDNAQANRAVAMVRIPSSHVETGYQARVDREDDVYNVMIDRLEAGARTTIAGPKVITPTLPFIIRCEAEGSTIRALVAGVEELSVVDAVISGNLQTGLASNVRVLDDVRIDNFEAGDLGIGPHVFFDLTDLPGDFGNAETAEIVVRTRGVDIGATPLKLFAQIFRSDETTPLSDEVEVASHASSDSFANSSPITFTGLNTTADKSVWDAARVRFRWGT